jgi:hypothetical protein
VVTLRFWHALAFVALFGCQFSARPLSGTLRCAADSDCPAGQRCQEAGRCVASAAGPAPRVTSVTITPARVATGGTVTVELSVDQQLLEAPVVSLLAGARRAATLQEATGQTYRYTFVVDAQVDREGAATIVADVVGSLGAVAGEQRLGTVDFDFTPPSVAAGTIRLTLTPPAGCPLPRVSALGPGGVATFELVLDEAATASIESEPAGLVFEQIRATSNYFAFSATARAADGRYQLAVKATDTVGNVQRVLLDQGVEVDAAPPLAPNVDDAAAVIYRRFPWGSLDAGPRFELQNAASGAPGAAAIEVLDGPSSLGLAEVDGGARIRLPQLDRPVVSVRSLDLACNASPAVEVKNVEWVATLAGKVPGRLFENPHRLFVTDSFSPSLAPTPWSTEVALPTPRRLGRSEWVSLTGPDARFNPTMVYDPRRQRSIRFGGVSLSTASVSDELWEWSGEQWENRTPSPRPAAWPRPVTSHAMVFDAQRGKALMFGGVRIGVSGGSLTDELWEWDSDGNVWRDLTPNPRPTNWPSARGNFGFAFDTTRRRLVLFAGTSGAVPFRDLWEWDGSVWVNRTPSVLPAQWPSARVAHRMVYDSVRRKMLLFGSEDKELWELTPDTGLWVQRSPVPLPSVWPDQQGIGAVQFVAERGTMLSFGGFGSQTNVPDRNLWEWNSQSGAWDNRTPVPLPLLWPTGRAGIASAFDSTRGQLVIHGGSVQGEELWEYGLDGGTWQRRNTEARPSARTGASLTFDPRSRTLLFFGGAESDELWQLDLQGIWTNRTPSPRPALWPTGRSSHSAGFDEARGRLVIYGGFRADQSLDDWWDYDPTTGTWANRTPSPRPADYPTARYGAPMTYDRANRRFLLFGGGIRTVSSFRSTDGLWELEPDAGVFRSLSPSPRPPAWPGALSSAGLTYDHQRQRLVLFGGQNTFVASDALWEWDANTGWVNLTPTPRPALWPPATYGLMGQLHFVDGRLQLWGGNVSGAASTQLWAKEHDGGWVDLAPTPRPPNWPSASQGSATAVDTTSGRLISVGGESAPSVLSSETWAWKGDESRLPGVQAVFSFAASGAEPTATLVSAEVVAFGTSSGTDAGVRLLLPNDGALRSVAEGASPLRWSSTDRTRLAGLLDGPSREIWVGLTPVATEPVRGPSSIASSWVELRVTYRR